MSVGESRCPRCGGGFHCSATVAQVNHAAPCACATVRLDAQTLAELRARYDTCLCLRCLADLAAAKEKAGPV